MTKRPFTNRLNELSPKDWLKFQKSWFIHNPPPRQKRVLRHPAKFPETLAMEFITFFTKPNEVVFDPMAGTGSTLVAAIRTGRNSYGIELNPTYAAISHQVLDEERMKLGPLANTLRSVMITGDAAHIPEIIPIHSLPFMDYMLTSPPYWDMLHMHGAAYQKERRESQEMDIFYSKDPNDLGNITDYDEFLKRLI